MAGDSQGSGWQTTAIAGASALLIYGNAKKWFSTPFEPWEMQLAVAALVLCGCLSLASIASAIAKAPNGPAEACAYAGNSPGKTPSGKTYSSDDPNGKRDCGYLLAKNQPMFTTPWMVVVRIP